MVVFKTRLVYMTNVKHIAEMKISLVIQLVLSPISIISKSVLSPNQYYLQKSLSPKIIISKNHYLQKLLFPNIIFSN